MKHATFHMAFIWVALTVALAAGFPIAAHLSFVTGLGFPVSRGFASFMQVHGHAQLVGWMGLFIIGVSLHVIPRLAGVPIAQPQWLRTIPWSMALGLGLRSIGQSVLPYLTGTLAMRPVAWLVVVSGVLEAWGILSYVCILYITIRGMAPAEQRPALLAVKPYFGMMLAGWVLYASFNAVLLVQMAIHQSTVLDPAWNHLAMQGFVGLVLLPVAFAFSVRMFPLYLRLAVPDWSVRGVAYTYLGALLVQVLPTAPPLAQLAPGFSRTLVHLGMVLRGGVILWFVWQLDVLTRRRAPWTMHRKFQPGSERRPTRPGLPDYGEFGGFERLVYAAYIWLIVAAAGEVVAGLATLLGRPLLVSQSVLLHLYLLGFITLLIFGMAVRMLPGFLRQRRVASAALVSATFWLGNAAVVSRVLLFLLPPSLLHAIPGGLVGARTAFALSGLLGWVAVGCLTVNLWRTAARSQRHQRAQPAQDV